MCFSHCPLLWVVSRFLWLYPQHMRPAENQGCSSHRTSTSGALDAFILRVAGNAGRYTGVVRDVGSYGNAYRQTPQKSIDAISQAQRPLSECCASWQAQSGTFASAACPLPGFLAQYSPFPGFLAQHAHSLVPSLSMPITWSPIAACPFSGFLAQYFPFPAFLDTIAHSLVS